MGIDAGRLVLIVNILFLFRKADQSSIQLLQLQVTQAKVYRVFILGNSGPPETCIAAVIGMILQQHGIPICYQVELRYLRCSDHWKC